MSNFFTKKEKKRKKRNGRKYNDIDKDKRTNNVA